MPNSLQCFSELRERGADKTKPLGGSRHPRGSVKQGVFTGKSELRELLLVLLLNSDGRLLFLRMCFHVLSTQDGFDILQSIWVFLGPYFLSRKDIHSHPGKKTPKKRSQKRRQRHGCKAASLQAHVFRKQSRISAKPSSSLTILKH